MLSSFPVTVIKKKEFDYHYEVPIPMLFIRIFFGLDQIHFQKCNENYENIPSK